jgi:hypothetical protein
MELITSFKDKKSGKIIDFISTIERGTLMDKSGFKVKIRFKPERKKQFSKEA